MTWEFWFKRFSDRLELMQRPIASRVRINATPSIDPVSHCSCFLFLTLIGATPREDKCNTINATPVGLTS